MAGNSDTIYLYKQIVELSEKLEEAQKAQEEIRDHYYKAKAAYKIGVKEVVENHYKDNKDKLINNKDKLINELQSLFVKSKGQGDLQSLFVKSKGQGDSAPVSSNTASPSGKNYPPVPSFVQTPKIVPRTTLADNQLPLLVPRIAPAGNQQQQGMLVPRTTSNIPRVFAKSVALRPRTAPYWYYTSYQ